jgi:hypothetical protein
MPLPSVEQYAGILEKKIPATLSTLNEYTFLYKEGAEKNIVFSIGTSAVVFKATKDSKNFAIRCFLRGELETFNRYKALYAYLSSRELFWKVGFEVLENEILFEGQFLPVIKMDWVDGIALNDYIDQHLTDIPALSMLQKRIVQLSHSLEENNIGHGDLKYNNIIIVPNGVDYTLKLIDYDSMFIPEFTGRHNLETGSPGFQPLKRLSSDFSSIIDRFSIWVMLTSLEAVKADPNVWKDVQHRGFNNENSIFTPSDFLQPASSNVFQKLYRLQSESLNYYLGQLTQFCKISDFSKIEQPTVHNSAYLPEEKTSWPATDIQQNTPEKQTTQAPKHIPEAPPVFSEPPVIEKERIISFTSDKVVVDEGEAVSVSWKVEGIGSIRIVQKGEVVGELSIEARTGNYKPRLKETTTYILQVGAYEEKITIEVKHKPALPPAAAVLPTPVEETKPVPVAAPKALEKNPAPVAETNPNEVQKTSPILHTTKPNAIPNGHIKHPVEKPSVDAKPKVASVPHTVSVSDEETKREPVLRRATLWTILLVLVLATTAFFTFNYIAGKKSNTNNTANTEAASPKAVAEKQLFGKQAITSFLTQLYADYNSRDLSGIMNHYARSVQPYYGSASLSNDSLRSVIKDLFITPAFYQCDPDFTTLQIDPENKTCKLVITINETLQSNAATARENYTTKIQYVVDSTFRIISEHDL